jgi:hypothetical protein
MVSMTFRGMQLLARLWPTGCDVPPLPPQKAEGAVLLEVMPGAVLRALAFLSRTTRTAHVGWSCGRLSWRSCPGAPPSRCAILSSSRTNAWEATTAWTPWQPPSPPLCGPRTPACFAFPRARDPAVPARPCRRSCLSKAGCTHPPVLGTAPREPRRARPSQRRTPKRLLRPPEAVKLVRGPRRRTSEPDWRPEPGPRRRTGAVCRPGLGEHHNEPEGGTLCR